MALFQILVLVLMIITITAAKRNFTKTGYFPVPVCPKNTQEWQASSQRLNCNDTHKYHCAPYRDLTQLYEFCYERTSLKVDKGFCIGIAESGILNLLTCSIFSHGCPPEDYDSNQLYKYPSCISIHNGCFTEDCVCNCQSAGKQSGQTRESASCKNQTEYLVAFVVCLVLLIPSFVANIVLIRSFKCNQPKQRKQGDNTNAFADEEQRQSGGRTGAFADEEHHLLSRLGTDESAEEKIQLVPLPTDQKTDASESDTYHSSESMASGLGTDESAEEKIQLVPLPTDRKTDASESDNYHSSENMASDRKIDGSESDSYHSLANMETDDIYKVTLVDYTLEDAELFILLKRQCLHQAYYEFIYLVNTRVKGEKDYIFTKRDENGCVLLHYAAQGGSTVILDTILENVSEDILQCTCIRGQNALHFAIRNDRTDMTIHLIKIYSKTFNKYDGKEKIKQSQTTDTNFTNGVFAPVHWVAWQGKLSLLQEFKNANFDISLKTKSGLNILDVACLTKLSDESNKFCIHVLNNESKYIDPMKTDRSGWTIGHYASKSGRVELLKFMEKNKTLRSLITAQTMSRKTCLHIACEFANFDAVKFLVTKFASLLHCKDKLNWNALHFAAKGGSLEILKYLLENDLEIGSLTKDQKTILHVACIHKNLDISRYAVEHLSPELLNTATNTSGLLACHYLAVETKKDGKEADILEVLCNSDMNLKATCFKGLTLLEWAIDHLNINLIRAVVSVKFREKCGVDTESLKKAITRKQTQRIITILQTALNEINKKS